MSEEQKPEGQRDEDRVAAPKDWSSDYFPTSARKVFLGWGVMIGGIVLLCFVAYATSEHSEETGQVVKQPSHSLARDLDDSAEE